MRAIETKELTKYYGKNRGIENVTLNVSEGDFFGFIGPNGAGKSTTIRTLLGFLSPTSGTGAVLGRDIVKEHLAVLKDVGYLPSEAAFYNGMRVREILALSARLRKTDCLAEGLSLCEKFSLDPDRKVDQLSLGNRKKVGIVCAMQHRPKLYILDEPTSGLDPLMQQVFYELLSERNKEGATVFLSSHVLSEISRYCRHAAVIREGRIIAADSVENLGHTGTKKVILRGASRDPDFPGIRDLVRENDTLRFLYTGSAPSLVAALNGFPFEDLTVADPELDEVFLHFYEGGETK
ncbi:MAG: ABC transporter ATP-binding protein [Clostridia bacterium]|nr:ABC transporter ATP-binding protein [Clostridia bacterium]